MQTARWGVVALGWLVAVAGVVHAAQGATSLASAKPATKPAPATKPVAAKRTPRKPAAPEPVPEAAPAPEDVQPLSAELLDVAEQVYVGTMSCELGAQVAVAADPAAAGRFVLELGRQRFRMTPVISSTGAVRLEDAQAGAVWLQLANKSMLMNQKLGKRMADDCTGAEQAEIARALTRSPVPGILEPRPPVVVPSAPAEPAQPSAVVLAEPAAAEVEAEIATK